MRRIITIAVLLVCFSAGYSPAEEYRGIFWNLHSGNSSSSFLASQMVAKGDIDFWGFSEVQGQNDVSLQILFCVGR